MRAARALIIVAVAALAVAACGSAGLTDDERTWCADNENAVLNELGALFAGDPMMDTITDEFVGALADGVTSLGEFLQQAYPSQYEESCRAAFADR
jgi:hypothetical protein